MKPLRIQLSRKAGWRMPENTVKCDRSTQFGNPHKVAETGPQGESAQQYAVVRFDRMLANYLLLAERPTIPEQEDYIANLRKTKDSLRGKNMACWCRLCPEHKSGKPFDVDCDKCAPCHVDTLLRVANK